jgi:hypothetical protein
LYKKKLLTNFYIPVNKSLQFIHAGFNAIPANLKSDSYPTLEVGNQENAKQTPT